MWAKKGVHTRNKSICKCAQSTTSGGTDPLLLRVARGEKAERTPVWLLRQAGRYMKDFRKYSEKLPFRQRSETVDIAVELSLQPWRAFKPDGVIMFSDILTPLPALGIEFDVIPGKGPRIANPISSKDDVSNLRPMVDPTDKISFVGDILKTLRQEIDNETALIGFVGTPWTLAAYSVEGGADRYLKKTKTMMFQEPQLLHKIVDHMSDALIEYISYQINSGAQIIQLFDSWAHHLSPTQFEEFSMVYVEKIIRAVKEKHPDTPVLFYVNGCGGKMQLLKKCTADVLHLDWNVDMKEAREILGSRTLQGNVDPMTFFGTQQSIEEAVHECLDAAGPTGHILNVGNGVIQGTPEDSVELFCKLAHESARKLAYST